MLLLMLACGSFGDGGGTETPTTATTTATTTTGATTTTTATTATTTTSEPVLDCPQGVDAVDLAMVVDFTESQPSVPRVDFTLPLGPESTVVSWRDSVVSHAVTYSTLDLPLAIPMEPGLSTTVTVTSLLDDGSCVTDAVDLSNGSLPVSRSLDMSSDWNPSEAEGRDMFLGARIANGDDPHEMVVWWDNGETQFSMVAEDEVHSVLPDPGGNGLWAMFQEDSVHDEASAEGTPNTDLVHFAWDGAELERFSVPAGHHDWTLSPDAKSIHLLLREHVAGYDVKCGKRVYADMIWKVDLTTGDVEQIWRAVDDFPMDTPCSELEDGDEISYLNGIEQFGDTIAASASGIIQGMLVGTADGGWHLVTDEPDSPYVLVNEGEVFGLPGIQQPHAAQCFENEEWGAGGAWAADAVACLISNRRQEQNCNTADLVVIEPSTGLARHVAAWPAGDSEDCRSSRDHGNVGLLGTPNPDGDGVSRVALFSRNAASVQVLSLAVGADGLGEFTLEYEVAEDVPGPQAPYFVTPITGISPTHTVTP